MPRTRRLFIVIAVLFTLGAGILPRGTLLAETPAPAAAGDQKGEAVSRHDVAIFFVPGLEPRLARKMALSLASQPGVKRALPIVAKQQLHVEFQPPTASPKTILEALKKAVAATVLKEVRPVGAPAGQSHDCGGCPLKSVCGGHASGK